MQRRALLYLVNFAVAGAVLLVFLAFPRYAVYAIYAFLGWFLVSLTTVWIARGGSPVTAPGPTVAVSASAGPVGPASAGRPARAGEPLPPTEVGFCIYCATDLPATAERCPSCGHPRARFA
jgi:hypothetical protein